MHSDRLKSFMPYDKYQGKVLLGNWFEGKCSYIKTPHDFKSNYAIDYCPKSPDRHDADFILNLQSHAQGLGARVLLDHQGPDFLENKATLNDLSYNHLTKISDGPIPRKFRFRFQTYVPENDYCQNFGNITKNGLLDYYKGVWACDQQDPRKTLQSEYKVSFCRPFVTKPRNRDLKFAVSECNPINWECEKEIENPRPCRGERKRKRLIKPIMQ